MPSGNAGIREIFQRVYSLRVERENAKRNRTTPRTVFQNWPGKTYNSDRFVLLNWVFRVSTYVRYRSSTHIQIFNNVKINFEFRVCPEEADCNVHETLTQNTSIKRKIKTRLFVPEYQYRRECENDLGNIVRKKRANTMQHVGKIKRLYRSCQNERNGIRVAVNVLSAQCNKATK